MLMLKTLMNVNPLTAWLAHLVESCQTFLVQTADDIINYNNELPTLCMPVAINTDDHCKHVSP